MDAKDRKLVRRYSACARSMVKACTENIKDILVDSHGGFQFLDEWDSDDMTWKGPYVERLCAIISERLCRACEEEFDSMLGGK